VAASSDWRIELTSSAEKSLKRLSKPDRNRLRAAIDTLPAGDIKKLRGRSNQFRLRSGEFRVVFEPDYTARRVVILEVFRRGAGYR
jgi:mRNA interferase RelE/StbE